MIADARRAQSQQWVMSPARWPGKSSTEFIQKDESTEKDGERNPEVDIGCDGEDYVALRVVHQRSGVTV